VAGRITVNACISRTRRRDWKERPEEFGDEVDYGRGATTACQESVITSVMVRELLAQIPPGTGPCGDARDRGMSVGEIAEATGSKIDAVRKQLSRTRKAFRELLRRHLSEEEI